MPSQPPQSGSTRASFRSSLTELQTAQKPSAGTAAYSRFVNRPFGRIFAAAAHSYAMTPNQVSVISALLSGTAIVLIAAVPRGALLGVPVAILLVLGYATDSADGQLARLRGGGSRSGEWLDHTFDCFKTSTLHVAVAVSWYRDPPGGSALLLLPLAFVVAATGWYFQLILVPTLRPAGLGGAINREEHPLRKWALLPVDYGVVCLAFLLLGWDAVFPYVYAVLMLASAGTLSVAIRHWWHELRSLDSVQLADQ